MDFTQIGSLPFQEIELALDYSFEHSIPFVPDLPAISKSEFMMEQGSNSIQSPYQQIAINKFMERAKSFEGVIKNQLPGPLCMMQFLEWDKKRAFQVFKSLLHDRVNNFSHRKSWIFIDEPGLFDHQNTDREELLKLLAELSSDKVFFAIHYCGKKEMILDNWRSEIGLSYDAELHPAPQLNPTLLIPGISQQISFSQNVKAITPPCGLWGGDDPHSTLEFLKKA